MKVSFHCFAYEAKIEPAALSFPFKGHTLSVRVHEKDKQEGLMLELSREATAKEFSTEGEIQDDQGNFIEKRLRPYKELITEAAQLVEGLFSIFYFVTPPKFDSDKILVNVITENPEEEQLIKSGKITGGFGNIFQSPSRPLYQLKDNIPAAAATAVDHLPALSFLAQAIRSQERNDDEVAFFLYFRIVEGYFSDGVKEIEDALLKKSDDLKKYINYNDETKNTTQSILATLKLNSKSNSNFEGLISDLVLIRHKLTHFSKTNAHRHHQARTKFDLNILNFQMRRACVLILRDQIGV